MSCLERLECEVDSCCTLHGTDSCCCSPKFSAPVRNLLFSTKSRPLLLEHNFHSANHKIATYKNLALSQLQEGSLGNDRMDG